MLVWHKPQRLENPLLYSPTAAAHAAVFPGWLCLFLQLSLADVPRSQTPLFPGSQCVFSITVASSWLPSPELPAPILTLSHTDQPLRLSETLTEAPGPYNNSCTLHTHKASIIQWLQDPLSAWTVTRRPADVAECMDSWEMNSGKIMTWTARIGCVCSLLKAAFQRTLPIDIPEPMVGGSCWLLIWNGLMVSS